MAKINDVEKIEQELAGLRVQVQESFVILSQLAEIQKQFRDLAQTYNALKTRSEQASQAWDSLETRAIAIVESATQRQESLESRYAELELENHQQWKNSQRAFQDTQSDLYKIYGNLKTENTDQLNNLKKDIEQRMSVFFFTDWSNYKKSWESRYAELETENHQQWNDIQSVLQDNQSKLYGAFSNLRTENTAQINNYKNEIEQRITVFLGDWNNYKAGMTGRMEKLENQRLSEFESFRTMYYQFQSETSQQLEKANTQLRKFSSAYQNTNKKILSLRIWLSVSYFIVVILGLLLAFTLVYTFWG